MTKQIKKQLSTTTKNQEKITPIGENKVDAAAMAEKFIETDDKLGKDSKKVQLHAQKTVPSPGMCPTSMDSLSSPK
jgi:hypothetical protein